MSRVQRCLTFAAACAVLAPVLALALRAQTHGTKIEIEGTPSQIDPNAETFVIEEVTVTATATTKFEDRQARRVDRKAFFEALHVSDIVEVKGHLKGNVLTARKIEIEHR